MKTTLYWASVIVSGSLCVAPLWLGTIPFLTDFGGHLEMAQAWNALGSDPFFDVFYERRETWLAPNLLAARFAALMHPSVDALTALRLFVSASLLGLMAALWFCLREFARSEWLLFPCIPFFWGGALTLGLINFVASFPLMFLALALGKRCAERDGWAPGVWLLVTSLVSFFMHGMGYLLVIAFAVATVFMFALASRSWKKLWQLSWLAPSMGLWVQWRMNAQEVPWTRGATYYAFEKNLKWFVREAADTFTAEGDDLLLLIPGVFLLVALTAIGALTLTKSRPPRGSLAWFASLTPTLLGLGMLATFFVLPAYYRGVSINTRLVTPLILCLWIGVPLPRDGVGARKVVSVLATALLVVALLASTVQLTRLSSETIRLERMEFEPLVTLIDQIPEYSTATCTGVRNARPVFLRLPLDHNCDALVQWRRDSFAGGGFANTVFNAVTLRDGIKERRLATLKGMHLWEYVIVRGKHARPKNVTLVDAQKPWTLYKIKNPKVPKALRVWRETEQGGPATRREG